MDSRQISLFPTYSHSSAVISKCNAYRYLLRRIWDDKLPPLVAGFLNPSTADADSDDPTITRVVRRAERIGCGSIVVWNVYAYRATDPKSLADTADPIGPQNHRWISSALGDAVAKHGVVMVGWGANTMSSGVLERLRKTVDGFGVQLTCLGMTRGGHPRHPLYVSYATELEPWSFQNLATGQDAAELAVTAVKRTDQA